MDDRQGDQSARSSAAIVAAPDPEINRVPVTWRPQGDSRLQHAADFGRVKWRDRIHGVR